MKLRMTCAQTVKWPDAWLVYICEIPLFGQMVAKHITMKWMLWCRWSICTSHNRHTCLSKCLIEAPWELFHRTYRIHSRNSNGIANSVGVSCGVWVKYASEPFPRTSHFSQSPPQPRLTIGTKYTRHHWNKQKSDLVWSAWLPLASSEEVASSFDDVTGSVWLLSAHVSLLEDWAGQPLKNTALCTNVRCYIVASKSRRCLYRSAEVCWRMCTMCASVRIVKP